MRKLRDLTYRKDQCDRRYVMDMAQRLVGQRIVVQMADGTGWRSAWLMKVYPKNDRFKVKWTKSGVPTTLRGVWRVHNAGLFSQGQKPRPTRLHELNGRAKVTSSNSNRPKEGKMATRTKAKAGAKKGPGRPKSTGGIAGLSDAQRKKLAGQIVRLKKQGVKWDGPDGICEQVGISSALQGRDLLREYGNADMVRERSTSNGGGSRAKAKAKPAAKGKAKPAASKSKRKVTVKRGRGRASNPS
jgi:hypothetical protein